MKNIFIVVRDVTGLELASDVQEIEDDQFEELEKAVSKTYLMGHLRLLVNGVNRYLNPANLVDIRLESLE